MATSIITGTSVSSSAASSASFGDLVVKSTANGTTINTDDFGLQISSDQGWYALQVESAYENPLRVRSTDGTGGIDIGDNSSTNNYNRIQVVGNDRMEFYVNNVEMAEFQAGEIAFNQNSADINFRIESNDNANLLAIDGAKNHMSIGMSRGNHTSDEILVVAGNTGITGSLHVSGNITTSGSIIAKEFRTEYVNQTITQASGSTQFGDSGDDTHEFTGSVHVSGALFVSGGNDSTPLINIHNSGSRDANIIEFDAWGSDQILGTKEWSEKTHGGVIMGQGYHANTGNSVFIRGGGNGNGNVEHHFTAGTQGYMMTAMGAAGTTELQIDYKGSISGSEIGTGSFGTLQVFDKGSDTQFWLGSSAGVARILYSGAYYQFTDADNSYGSISAESGSFYGDVGIRATKKLYFDDGEPPVAGHTYISEASGDTLDFVVGGQQMLRMFEGGTDQISADDNVRLGVGSSQDLMMYHDASNSYFVNKVGHLYIQQQTDDGDIVLASDDGSGGTDNYLVIDGGAVTIDLLKDTRVAATKKLFFDGGGNTYILEEAADILNFHIGGVHMLSLDEVNDEAVFNEGSADIDFRVESNGQSHMLFVDGGNDTVGIKAPVGTQSASFQVGGGIIRTVEKTDGILSTTQETPVGHYTTGDEVFSIDPTWSDDELRAFMGRNNQSFTASHDAPGGYAVYVDGYQSSFREAGAGMPVIPLHRHGSNGL